MSPGVGATRLHQRHPVLAPPDFLSKRSWSVKTRTKQTPPRHRLFENFATWTVTERCTPQRPGRIHVVQPAFSYVPNVLRPPSTAPLRLGRGRELQAASRSCTYTCPVLSLVRASVRVFVCSLSCSRFFLATHPRGATGARAGSNNSIPAQSARTSRTQSPPPSQPSPAADHKRPWYHAHANERTVVT
jgi:hypothetical protein